MTTAAIDEKVMLDASRTVGTWHCSNRNTTGIARFTVRAADGRLYLNIVSRRDGADYEWGEAAATAYANSFESREVFSLFADYDFGFQRVHVQAIPRRGVMVIGTLTEFTDDSGRIGAFVREFFYRERP